MNFDANKNLLRLLWIEHKLPKFVREEINEKALLHLQELTKLMGPELASRFISLQQKTSSNIAINPHTKVLGCLLMIEKNLSPDFRIQINDNSEELLNSLADCIGFLLYHHLDDKEISEEVLRTLVQCVPQVLSEDDPEDFFCDYGEIPLLSMCRRGQQSFVPMLVEEGVKHNVCGEGMLGRGGLFYKRHDEQCLIGELAFVSSQGNCDADGDTTKNPHQDVSSGGSLDIIKRLRDMGLLKKDDIRQHNLLQCSSRDYEQHAFHPTYRQYDPSIFSYFVDWDPSALREPTCSTSSGRVHEGDTILHLLASSQSCRPCDFQLGLRATLCHYRQELGLLLLESNGVTPLQLAKERHGKEKAWKLIEECLEEPACDKIALEKNEETNLYPFLTAAAGETSELDLVYHLLRRHPAPVEHCTSTHNTEAAAGSSPRPLSRKRKRVD